MLKSIEELRAFRAEAKAQLDAENKKIVAINIRIFFIITPYT